MNFNTSKGGAPRTVVVYYSSHYYGNSVGAQIRRCSCAQLCGGVRSAGGVSSANSVARSNNIIFRNMQSVRAPACPTVLMCVFGISHDYWVEHWYFSNAVPSFFSEHMYLPSCGPLGHLWGQKHSLLYKKTLYLLNRAVAALEIISKSQ